MGSLSVIFTEADKRLAKKHIPNYRGSYVIDLADYILEAEYVRGGHVSSPKEYMANNEIIKKLKQSVENKRSVQIVYYHFDINETMLDNVRGFYDGLGVGVQVAVFDPPGRLSDMYGDFDRVVPYVVDK